jgi:predicted TPR repeat methyltransferase
MAKYYDAAATDYEKSMRRAGYFSPGWIAKYAPGLEDCPEFRVLDLGCGTGLNIKALCEQRAGIRADGVDLSPKMLERARATNSYESFYARDLNNEVPDIPSGIFDLVVAFGFFDLLSDVRVCLSECRRVLKVNGTLWASFRRFEADDEGSPPRHVSVEGIVTTGHSAGEILQMMRFLTMRVIALDAVVGYITRTGFDCPFYVLRARKAEANSGASS